SLAMQMVLAGEPISARRALDAGLVSEITQPELTVERIGLPTRRRPVAPQQLFGLELAPESLPDDVASEAERLWAEQPRAALG
ncbi:hypothetical protein, partial [Lactococcus petauri]|uniref:hypothetical protein n=1 Tax=Lactococcus petauri TaxID=1940789 RepID=UPI0021F0CD74